MRPIRDTSESAACWQAVDGPMQGILASTPVVIQHTAHHRRWSASLATRSKSVPGSGHRAQLERRPGKLASRLGLRVQSLAILLVVVVLLGLMALVLFIFSCRKLKNGIPFKGLPSYAISTARQPLTNNGDIALQPLR